MKCCTNCGSQLRNKLNEPARELYDVELHKKSGILKLMTCSLCGEVADKHIEQDGTLILIDLTLQSRSAYRHVLLNGAYTKLILKMALLTLICDGYISWAALPTAGEFFEQEYQFYVECSKSALALFAYLLVSLLPTLLFISSFHQLPTLILGILMAYSSRFCNLAALLWAPRGGKTDMHGILGPDVMWHFIYLLFFVSSFKVQKAILGSHGSKLFIVVVLAHVSFNCIGSLDAILNPFECVQ